MTLSETTTILLARRDGASAAAASVTSAYRRQLDWLADAPGLSPACAAILAGRAAGCLAALSPSRVPGEPLPAVWAELACGRPNRALLDVAARLSAPTHGGRAELSARDVDLLADLWDLAPPTEWLLASGGDDRLTLSADGRNRYGCTPWPQPEIICFSSCTASSPSPGAFAAAERARQALLVAAAGTSASAALAEASDAIAAELLAYFGCADLAECILAASGTDAALIVTGLLAAEHPHRLLTSVLMSPSETGSGVPDAVQGRHFAACTPAGLPVGKGLPIDGLASAPGLITIALRDPSGLPRPASAINADCEAAISLGIARGRVVLHAIDGSKTGLTAPDRAACSRLANRYGGQLDIVIDACQARIEPALARWYLQQGFAVLVTGSKFFGAPGFCGAVLFPRARLHRIADRGHLPAGLEPYARLQGGFGSRRCPGLVLRWRAALNEMAAFAALPGAEIGRRLDRIGMTITRLLADHPAASLVPAPRPDGMGWSDRRSVFTAAIRGPSGWMGPKALRPLYQALNTDMASLVRPGHDAADAAALCQVGQPVEIGSPALGGLRLAISAAQIVEDADQAEPVATILRKLTALLASGSPASPPQGRADAAEPAEAVLLIG